MNFVLDATLFEGEAPANLVVLVFMAALGRHRIEVPEESRSGFEAWAGGFGEIREELLRAEALSAQENARAQSGTEVRVKVCEHSAWSKMAVGIDDAVELALKPFRVLLENGVSDRHFLLAVLRKEDRQWLEERADKEWVELEGCGGIRELDKRVRWTKKRPSRVVRCAALFDGDAVEPPANEPESEDAFRDRLAPASRELLDHCDREPVCESAGLLHHVLRRRSIENYLPVSDLERWTKLVSGKQRRARMKAVASWLRCPHRFQYNMKSGYRGDRKRIPQPSWVPCDKSSALEKGFGDGIASRFAGVGLSDLDADARRELQPFTTELLRRLR